MRIIYLLDQVSFRQARLECVAMIIESFEGYAHKYSYSIVGHSGDGPDVPFVEYGKPPRNLREKYQLLRKMVAHAEYCATGDHTLLAVEKAIKEVVKEEADDYFVFLVSDANLGRYEITPEDLRKVLSKDLRVSAFAIFIASNGAEAERFKTQLPLGKAFLCLDTSTMPGIFKQIFTSAVLKS